MNGTIPHHPLLLRKQTTYTIPDDNNGQLIVLMGIILAISVFLISSLPTELAGLNIAASTQRSSFLLPESLHISETFGLAFQNNFADIEKVDLGTNRVVYKPSNILTSTFTNAFTTTKSEFQQLLLRHDIILDASILGKQFQYLSDQGHVYHVRLYLQFFDGPTGGVNQYVIYSIVSKEQP